MFSFFKNCLIFGVFILWVLQLYRPTALADEGSIQVAEENSLAIAEQNASPSLPEPHLPRAARIPLEFLLASTLAYLPALGALRSPELAIHTTALLSPLLAGAGVHFAGWLMGGKSRHWTPYLGSSLSATTMLTMAASTYEDAFYISIVSFLITPFVAVLGATIAYEISDANVRRNYILPIVQLNPSHAVLGVNVIF